MTQFTVTFFEEKDGTVPFRRWFLQQSPAVQDKCFRSLKLLEDLGHGLRRPLADYVRDGIYEPRIRHQRRNYRILYFFAGKGTVVISHGLTKEDKIPEEEIDRAMKARVQCEKNHRSRAAKGILT
jgi:phage-related protein